MPFISATKKARVENARKAREKRLAKMNKLSVTLVPSDQTTPGMTIYESTFAPSDQTDAILIVDGKKLHVNKAVLSDNSYYFKTLFNSDFAEKSMPEIPIKDVNFEDFATLLSLIQDKPIKPTESNCERLLELADRFQMLSAERHVELFINSTDMDVDEKYRISEKFRSFTILLKIAQDMNKRALELMQKLQMIQAENKENKDTSN